MVQHISSSISGGTLTIGGIKIIGLLHNMGVGIGIPVGVICGSMLRI